MFESFKSTMHNRQRKAWEMKRRLGKRSFIVRRGMLRWGGIMFVLTTITNVFARHGKPDWMFEISLLIACPFAGYLWARSVWYLNERRFQGAGKQQDSIKGES